MADDLRLTKNQSVVLDVLKKAGKPLGAYSILAKVRDAGLNGPPQVYRALDKLVATGLVHRIECLNAFLACDHGPHNEPSLFVICTDCHETVEVSVGDLDTILKGAAIPEGFDTQAVRIEISGRCQGCAAQLTAH